MRHARGLTTPEEAQTHREVSGAERERLEEEESPPRRNAVELRDLRGRDEVWRNMVSRYGGGGGERLSSRQPLSLSSVQSGCARLFQR